MADKLIPMGDVFNDFAGHHQIAGAELDVFVEEPLPLTSRLWEIDRILITPHVSGPIVPEDVIGCFLENLRSYLRGEPLRRQVDRRRCY